MEANMFVLVSSLIMTCHENTHCWRLCPGLPFTWEHAYAYSFGIRACVSCRFGPLCALEVIACIHGFVALKAKCLAGPVGHLCKA